MKPIWDGLMKQVIPICGMIYQRSNVDEGTKKVIFIPLARSQQWIRRSAVNSQNINQGLYICWIRESWISSQVFIIIQVIIKWLWSKKKRKIDQDNQLKPLQAHSHGLTNGRFLTTSEYLLCIFLLLYTITVSVITVGILHTYK
jgi:hypothetical protein